MTASGVNAPRASSASRLQRARLVLAAAVAVRGALLAATGTLASLAVLLLVDVLVAVPIAARSALAMVPWLVGGLVLVGQLAGPLRQVVLARATELALWFEQRLPHLRYALVTQTELGSAAPPALGHAVDAAPLESEASRGARTLLLRPALAAAVLATLLLVMPPGAVGRVLAPAAGDGLSRPGAAGRAAGDPLAAIVVRVTPPAYSGLRASAQDNPATVSALVGSRIQIEGLGRGVRAVSPADTLRASARGADGWMIVLVAPAASTALRLVAPNGERVLLLDPIADSVPSVRLLAPTRDTVLRTPRGRVTLEASLEDDLGLASAQFEFIISAGSGEAYTFRSGSISAAHYNVGVRRAEIRAELVLDTLRLAPGDLVHLRAVAADRNDITGPGRGVSETRAIRVARADEYDSVSVEPAPPPALDTAALSQRMILMLTEELHARERRLDRAVLSRESRKIAVDQTKLRKRVGEVVFQRLGEDNAGEHAHFAGDGHAHGEEGPVDPAAILAAAERAANVDPTRNLDHDGDETPIVAINRPLLEAYNHMWRASTELETANPGAAIPWMKRAIEALQRARAAERIYLRGRPPRVVIDLARVRGTGKDDSAPTERAARAPIDPDRALRLARFDATLGVVEASPAAAADSLLLIRITLPTDERAAAMLLDAAANALRRGGDVTEPLAAARRALAGEPTRRGAVRAWGH